VIESLLIGYIQCRRHQLDSIALELRREGFSTCDLLHVLHLFCRHETSEWVREVTGVDSRIDCGVMSRMDGDSRGYEHVVSRDVGFPGYDAALGFDLTELAVTEQVLSGGLGW
jgi:hypothetical protein